MMRLRRLGLDLFGHFTGHALDFGPRRENGPDFHIVYGPNEAGKTTTMEGYLRLLYGFDARESYAFRHERKALRVSGILDIDGVETPYTRLPSRNASLVDGSNTPVPQAPLDAALAGLSQEDYRKLFCLDDVTIEKGGEEIIDSKGDVGRMLFAASAGISDLSAILDGVTEETRALYLKGSGKPQFAVLNAELKEINAQIREGDVSATAWRGLREALEAATADEAAANTDYQDARARELRLAAMADMLPLLDEVETLRTRLSDCARYPDRLDIDPESLVTLLADQQGFEADQTRLTGEIETLQGRLDAIERDPDCLSLAAALDDLDDLYGQYRAAVLHLPNRRTSLDEAMAQMRRAADDLGIADTVDLETLALSPAKIAALDKARDRLEDALRDAEKERAELRDIHERVAEAQQALDALASESPHDPEIDGLLARFDRAGHAVATQQIADAQGRYRKALAALAIKGKSFDAPPAVSLTATEAADMVERLAALERTHAAEAEKLDAIAVEEANAEARITALTARAGIVADAEVETALAERTTLWSAHRRALSDETADDFETAMVTVDAMASRRVEQATDLGELRGLETERAECAIRSQQSKATLKRHAAALAEARAPLDALSSEVGLTLSPTPGGIVAWLEKVEMAHGEALALEDATAVATPMLDKGHALAGDLARLLPEARPNDDLATLLDMAEAQAKTARTHASAVQRETGRLDSLRKTEKRRTGALEKAEIAQEEARTAWVAMVADISGEAIDPDTLLASLDPLRTLRAADDDRRDMASRIEKMEAEQGRFRAAVTALAEKHGIIPADDPLDTHASLAATGDLARKAEDRWLETNEQLDAKTTALDTAEQSLAQVARQIADLGTAFDPSIPTDTIDALRKSVIEAHTIIADREALAAHEQTIRTRLTVPDIEAAHEMLAGRSAEAIAAERAALATDIDLAETRYRTTIGTRQTAGDTLRAVTGDADIARLVERRRTIELDLQEVALDYLELKLGQDLANEAIRRYREENRHAMLDATERAFADLTNGAYASLTTRPDGASETLLAIDADGTSKAATAMSKGTRFQLFLALRAAAYEQMAAKGVVLPFFCDDVFETFDEDRTRAACALMARIGETGQAIYLTHHRHVIDLACEVCGDAVTIHDISPDAS